MAGPCLTTPRTPACGYPHKSLPASCCLRPWAQDDKAALVRHANNRQVWRHLADIFPHPYTEADADFWIDFARQAEPSIHLAIEFEGQAVGGAGIISGEDNFQYTGQFGYWLGQACWGQGLATAAARALVQHAFAHTPLIRLEARVFAWNAASMRVLEKAGFIREGLHRKSVNKDGQIIDSVMYALVRDA